MAVLEMTPSPPEEEWRSWSPARKRALLHDLKYNWNRWARAEQRPPGRRPNDGASLEDWDVWAYLGGRGTGKTRSVGEEAKERAKTPDTIIGIVAPTHRIVRDVCIEGRSGILAITPPSEVRKYNRGLGQVWLTNGSVYYSYSSTEPDLLRGPEHHFLWFEEFAAFRYPRECWDTALPGLRLGDHPQAALSTTPRPIPILKEILADPRTAVTKGRTLDNARNLPPVMLRYLLRKYGGTIQGRQELDGEIIEDVEGALWRRFWIERDRLSSTYVLPTARRTVIAVDPSGGEGKSTSDECGIVVAMLGVDDQLYVLDDLSDRMTPGAWAKTVSRAYREYRADAVVFESNLAGAVVREVLQRAYRWLPLKPIQALVGKEVRAEPVSLLYQRRGQVHHVGNLGPLEDQLCVTADTRVTTRRGAVPISEMGIEDEVLTSDGWAPVLWIGKTGDAEMLTSITTSETQLRCTPSHPVWTNQGWLRADRVSVNDKVWGCASPANEASWSTVVSVTTSPSVPVELPPTLDRVAPSVLDSSMSSCGRKPTVRSRPVTSSTTATMTRPMLDLRTLNVSPEESTSDTTASAVRGRVAEKRKLLPAGNNGADAGRLSAPAPDAVTSSLRPACVRPSAPDAVGGATTTPVWNLQVAAGHRPEFFANGVLVHNCSWVPHTGQRSPDRLDALVYALLELTGGGGGGDFLIPS